MPNLAEKALALCHAIEAAGASEQLTKCSVLASELRADIAAASKTMKPVVAYVQTIKNHVPIGVVCQAIQVRDALAQD